MSFHKPQVYNPGNFGLGNNRAPATTHEGGAGYTYTSKEELYFLVATSFFAGDNFYESQSERVLRMQSAIEKVLKEPDGAAFVAAVANYARSELYMRSGPSALVAELFLANAPESEWAAEKVWLRGDEHLETAAYVKGVRHRKFPKRFLRAIGRRIATLTEKQAVKYAGTGSSKSFSQHDLVRLSHPTPSTPKESALLKYFAWDWTRLSDEEKALLPVIADAKSSSGITWEQVISKDGSTAESWAKVFPDMGYMALLRNLRNLMEKAPELESAAAERIADKEEIAKSKQLPFRYLSAYSALHQAAVHAPKLMSALVQAMDESAANLPDLPGRTLILVDVSRSMQSALSDKSQVAMVDAAACLGAILQRRAVGDMWAFGTVPHRMDIPPGTPVMAIVLMTRDAERITQSGTDIPLALATALRIAGPNVTVDKIPVYDRIIVCTDMQTMDSHIRSNLRVSATNPAPATVANILSAYRQIQPGCRYYGINLTGYAVSAIPQDRMTIEVGGFSDKILSWMLEMEKSDVVGEVMRKFGPPASA